jgi:hypothetical protein
MRLPSTAASRIILAKVVRIAEHSFDRMIINQIMVKREKRFRPRVVNFS